MIYLLLLLFTIAQARGLFSADQNAPEGTRRIGWLFFLSSAANIGWLLLWHYKLVDPSFVAMLVILAALLATHVRLGTGHKLARQLFSVGSSMCPSASTSAGSLLQRSPMRPPSW